MKRSLAKNLLRRAAVRAAGKYCSASLPSRKFRPGDRVPYGGRVYDRKEVESLTQAALDFWLTSGKYCAEMEAGLASFVGVKYCSLVNSGSSANLLAFACLCDSSLGRRAILPGDEVITAAACFPTTVAPILQHGAVPVFVDIEPAGGNVSLAAVKKAFSSKTKAVFLAHTLGNPFNISGIKKFCTDNGLWLIEDNCDALGSEYLLGGKWRRTGSFGDIATLSFYPAHHITTGEGGAVLTDNPRLKRITDSLRDWGRDCWCASGTDNTCKKRFSGKFGTLPVGYDHKYVYSRFGYNLKMTDLQAAIGCAQLEKLPGFIAARRKNWLYLKKRLEKFSDRLILPEPERSSRPSWFGFLISVRQDAGVSRDELVSFLESRNIQTRPLFAGNITRHPCFDSMRASRKGYRISGSLENSDFITNNAFWVGVYPGLSRQQLEWMADSFEKFFSRP